MINEANKTKIKNLLGDSKEVTIKRSSSDPKKRIVLIDGEVKEPGTGFDNALNDFLPKFEYVSTRHYFEDVAKYSNKTPVGIMLSTVLEAILESDKNYIDFKKKLKSLFTENDSEIKVKFDNLGESVKLYLEKQFSECKSVTFEVTPPSFEDLLKKFETLIDDGVETSAHEKGDGMQRALMLAIIQAYADFRKDREDNGKSFLFFIDEAELHLHPTAQRKLKNVLLELCKNQDQVFLNTHSSVFIADENEHQSIHKVEKSDGETNFELIDEIKKPYVVFELLGGSPSDLLLPKNFLIVEGPSEVEFLIQVIRRFYNEKPLIQIVSAEGDTHQIKRSINAIKKAFSPLKSSIYENRLVILCDKPSDTASTVFDDFKKENKSIKDQIFVLEKPSLEEYYPEEWNKDPKNMKGKCKINLAREVGQNITKEAFETNMGIIYNALDKAWAKSF